MTLYGLLVSLGNQLGLSSNKPQHQNDEWLPKTGLSISMVFNRIIKIIMKYKINTIFVIDEIDNLADLVSKTGKDVLYQLTRANEHLQNIGSLTLIGISNDLTFKERLDPRVISSLSEEEIIFPNYNVNQIKEILQDRIKTAFIENSVDESAVNLCSALAGQEHGDARRAIDLLRVAGEIAEREQSNSVKIIHIKTAYKKTEEDKEITAITSYSLHEKLVIVSLLKSNKHYTGDVYLIYKELCKIVGQKALTQRRITQILSELELTGIVSGRIINQGIHGRSKKHSLTISSDIIKNTLQNDIIFSNIL